MNNENYSDNKANDSVSSGKKLYFFIKRVFDIVFCVFALLILALPLLLICVFISIDSKGFPIYVHKRVGKNGKIFNMYKLRTMYSDSDERLNELLKDPDIEREWRSNYKLENDPRLTKIGKFLRKTSLDELPQLLNIIKGDMSLVGPRPLVEDEVKKYGPDKERLLSVRPGLTGWWACNGRSDITYKKRMELELYYVDNCSLLLDIKCIFLTIPTVLFKHLGK